MTNKSSGVLFIPRGNSFDIDFANYEFGEEFEQIRELMSDRRFTVGEAAVAYRVINHWQESDVLPDGVRTGGGWRKFTLPELIWLRIICRLRAFGLSLEKIARVKEKVLKWDKKEENYPYFEFYVARALMSKSDPHVCVLADGEAHLASLEELEASRMVCGDFDVLLISVKSILEEMGLDAVEANRMFALTENEIELLAAFHLERSSEVRIKANPRGEISEIESSSTFSNPIAAHEVQNHMKTGRSYGSVVTKFENGVPKSTKITKRKRL